MTWHWLSPVQSEPGLCQWVCHKFEHYQAMFKIGNLKCEEDIEILFPVKHKLSDAACEFLKGIFVSYEQRPYAWDLKDDTWLTTSST